MGLKSGYPSTRARNPEARISAIRPSYVDSDAPARLVGDGRPRGCARDLSETFPKRTREPW
ncbi:hypothetical protein GCM10011609_57620 [Lentzea pudingi]|uniref:Uncharacterized protein n=1 Tax=Lentzea pudingi TaxID=1789439 RepID=A0ABQ2IJG6_9PSEU|nr:hypothetical protein GCM10011609_57620 [Lentzea pudingi]